MSPRTGRPTDNPKGTSTHVRLDKESKEILDTYCEQENVSKMEAIRRVARLPIMQTLYIPKVRYVNIIALRTSVWQPQNNLRRYFFIFKELYTNNEVY